jgi:predicted metal-dependent enzyme (double-stranded beta helix superfamily)
LLPLLLIITHLHATFIVSRPLLPVNPPFADIFAQQASSRHQASSGCRIYMYACEFSETAASLKERKRLNQNDTIAAFISDIKQILAADPNQGDDLGRIAERMRKLVAEPIIRNWQEETVGNVHSGQQSRPLYQDESGLTLMHARFGPEAMTPIHNHNSWAIIGVYRGRDLYQKWRRIDAGNGAGKAQVELIEEHVLEPGDIAIVPAPPQDIHAQQGFAGESAYELVLFGTNPAVQPRLYFDPIQEIAYTAQRA